MSRVYEALRQSELDNGVSPNLLDPDTFLAASTSAAITPTSRPWRRALNGRRPPAFPMPGLTTAWKK